MTAAALLLLQQTESRLDAVYFWSSVLIAILPISVFVVLAFLAVRGYFRRSEPDGGGDPPSPTARRSV